MSRQRHYVIFCLKTAIDDFLLHEISPIEKNYILACYTASLTESETLLCKSIRTATVKKYLDAVSEMFVLANLHDPIKNLQGVRSPYIEAVLKEHLRWETVPNRREPLTYKMVDFAYQTLLERMIHDTDFLPDSLEECLCDWLILGMQTGARLSEWCQDHAKLNKTKTTEKNIDGTPKAFIFNDFHFLNQNNVRRSNSYTSHIADAAHVQITWRYQKNNDNGQKLIFTENKEHAHRCPVRAAMRIRARAQKYGLPENSPLAIFRESTGKISFITNKHVRRSILAKISPNCLQYYIKRRISPFYLSFHQSRSVRSPTRE